ncbi:MAG TPA: TonB-dependent receptor [Vicinamibacterales bacterium]|nr:TonB-dependent receptor [Vicinamibacterales bacterium]
MPQRLRWRSAVVLVLLGVAASPPADAQTVSAQAQVATLKQLDIEELLEVSVALPSRREERIFNAPTAITVLTNEDIRRSGAVSLPEVLRSAPGLFAARSTTTSWAITARGFASSTSNKMLVMIDGRTVYSPLFSGVFWENQDAILADLDRIEVVRGPGAALWGSNAVNGVINVVSKRARDTQGTLIMIGGGIEENGFAGVRYGGHVGDGYYRVYAKAFDRDDAKVGNADAEDGQRFGQGGFRWDLGGGPSTFTLQGDAFISRAGLFGRDDIENSGVNLLGRWTRAVSANSEFQALVYYDRTMRLAPLQFEETRNTFDLDLQYRWDVGARHTLSVGGGQRVSADRTEETPLLLFVPDRRTTTRSNLFAHYELRWTPKVTTHVGGKIERNDDTGIEFQPTARVRWSPTSTHMVWAAASRAVRLPTRLETDVRVKTPTGAIGIVGNPAFASEELIAFEAGHRAAFGGIASIDTAVFRNRYDQLRTREFRPGQPVQFGNGLNARASGVELTLSVQPRKWSRFTGSYAYLKNTLSLDASSRDVTGGLNEAIDPAHQVWLQSRLDLPRRLEFDVWGRHVSTLPHPGTPAYTEAGFRLGWRATENVEIALIGRDLLQQHHLEFSPSSQQRRTQFERALFTRATLAF